MQNLYYNITGEQSLTWDAPEGRPSSVTSVTVYPAATGDDGTAEAATDGSATVESNPDTTFDAASGDGQTDPTVLALAATTGCEVGRRYLATNASGETEFVPCIGVEAGVSIQSRHSLRNSYAIVDTLESTRISISIDDTWIADSANISDDPDPNAGYRVRWVYVVGGVTRVHDSYFNVVRYRAGHSVRPDQVNNKRSGWLDALPTEHVDDNGAVLIDDAYSDFKFDLHKRKIPAEMLRNREVVNQMTILRTLLNTSKEEAVKTGDVTAYEIDREAYFGSLDGLVPVADTASDASGAGGRVPAVSIWGK
jgi:hypothetical protein